MAFFKYYRRDRERQSQLERERLALEREKNLAENSENIGIGSGGYIVLDLPDEQRGLFQDMLKGFEDFAKLKGYSISFSVDSSLSNKIGFKFTINNSGVSVSAQKVRGDIKEYMDKIKNGESVDDLPVLISDEEHSLVLTQMKNRIRFLQHNYNLQKNSAEFYEGMLKKLNSARGGIQQQPTVFVQTGGTNQPQHYLATNSPGSIQGNNIQDIESTIRIAESFNEKKNQIEDLAKFIELIKKSEVKDTKESRAIVKNLEKVKDEIEEEKEPDKKSVEKWLKKAKSYFDVAKFGKEVAEFGQQVFESFDLTSLT